MAKYFRLGQLVKVSKENDNSNYDDFRNKKLKISSVAKNTKEHPGYDDTMEEEPLYDLVDTETGKTIGLSLYFYELESWN